MNASQYAKHRGVSHVAVLNALKSGRITKEPDGSIDPEKADVQWERNTDFSRNPNKARRTRASETPLPSGPDYNVSRAVREAYIARLAKLEYEEKIGSLVKAEDVKLQWFNTLRIVRDRVLQAPDRLASILAAETDTNTIKQTLDAELRRILDDAADEIDAQE